MGVIPVTPIIVVIIGVIFTSGGNSLSATANAPLKQPTLWLGVVKVTAESAKWLLNPNWLSNSSGEKEWTNVTIHCNDSKVPVLPFLSLARNFSCRHATNTSSDGLLAWCIIDAREAYGKLKQTPVAHGSDRILSAVIDFIRTMKHLYVFNATKEEGQETELSSLTDSTILQVQGQPLGYKEPPEFKNMLMKRYEVVINSKEMQTGATTQSKIPTDQLVTNMALLKSGSSLSPKPTTVENASSGKKQSIPKPQQTASVWVSIFKQLLKLNQFNCESNNDQFTGNLGVDSTSAKSNGLSKTERDSLNHEWGKNNSFNSTALKKHKQLMHEAKSTSGIGHVLRKARDEQPRESKSNKRSHKSPPTINSDVINSQVKHPTQGTADERTGGRPETKKLADMKSEVGTEVKRPENNTNAVRSGYMTAGGKTSTPKDEIFNLKLGQKEPGVKSGDRTGMVKPKDKRQVVEPETGRPVLKPEQKQPGVKSGNKTATPRPGEKKPVLEPGTGRPVVKPEQKQPGVKSGNKTATPRPGEKRPVIEPGTEQPVLKPEQKQPGVKSGNKTATPRPGEKKPVLEPETGRPVVKPEQKQSGIKTENKTVMLSPEEKTLVAEPATGLPVLKPEQSGIKPENITADMSPEEKSPLIEPTKGRPVFKLEQKQHGVKTGIKTAKLRPGQKKTSIEPRKKQLGLKPEQNPGIKSGDRRADLRLEERRPLIKPVRKITILLRPKDKRPSVRPKNSRPGFEPLPLAEGSSINYNKPVAHSSIVVLFPYGHFPSNTMTAANDVKKRQHLHHKVGVSMGQGDTRHPSHSSRFSRNLGVHATSTTSNVLSKSGQDSFRLKNGNYTFFNSRALTKHLKSVREANLDSQLNGIEEYLSRIPNRELTNAREEQSGGRENRKGGRQPPAGIISHAGTLQVKHPAIKIPEKQGLQSEGAAGKQKVITVDERTGVRSNTIKRAHMKPEVRPGNERSGNKTSAVKAGDIGADGKRPRLEDKRPDLKQACVTPGDGTAILRPRMNRPLIEPRTGAVLQLEQKKPGIKSRDRQAEHRHEENIPLIKPETGRPVFKPELRSGIKSIDGTATLRPRINRPLIEPRTGPFLKSEQKRPGINSGDRQVEHKPGKQRGLIGPVAKNPTPLRTNNKRPKDRPVGSQTLPAAPISSATYTKPEAHSSIVLIFPSGYLPNNPMMVENDVRKKQHLHNEASVSMRQGDTRRSSIAPHAGTLGPRTPEPAARVQISNVVLVNPHEAALQMVRTRCGNTVREGPIAFISCVKDSGTLDGGSSGRQLRVETKREANDSGNKSFPLGNPMNASQSENKQRDTLGQSKIGTMMNELQGKLPTGTMTQLGTERPPQSFVIQEGGSSSSRLPLSTTVENKPQLNMTVVAVQVAKLYLELGGYLNKGAKARLAVEDCSVFVYESLRKFVECVEKAQSYEVGSPIKSILPQTSHRDQDLVVVASRAQKRDKHSDGKDMAEGKIWLP